MSSRFLRHSFGPFVSPRVRGTRFIFARVSPLLLGATIAAGALLVAPRQPYAWAAPAVAFVGDENGPKVKISSPIQQDVLKGQAGVVVNVKATQFNPATIQLFIDGKAVSEVVRLSSFSSMTFNWDTKAQSDGQHKLSVVVTDTQGFRGTAEVSVYLNNQKVRDKMAPDVSWDNIKPFQQMSGTTRVQLQTKGAFGLKRAIISLNPIAKSTKRPAQREWLFWNPPLSFDLDTTKMADGLYVLSAKAWDAREQEGESPVLTIGVVNSPVNATTVGESLDDLKAASKAQQKTDSAPAPPKIVAAQTPKARPNAPAKAPVVPKGYDFIDPKSVPSSGVNGKTTAPTDGDLGTLAPSVPGDDTTDTRVALQNETAQTDAALSSRKNDVLAPSRSGQLNMGDVRASDPQRVARLDAPKFGARAETSGAALSPRASNATGALTPAISPATPATQERVQIARLSAPDSGPRELDVAPVLSSAKTSLRGAMSQAKSVTQSAVSGPALVASAPELKAPRRNIGVSKVVLSQRSPKANAAPKEEQTPQLSARKTLTEGVVATKQVTPFKVPPRIATLPRPGASAGRPVEVAPDAALLARPSITVSPVQVAFNEELPSSYQARHKTSVRAIAAHFRLPVELVASANGWASDHTVNIGTHVKLPRQVQLSYNGQKVRGDVASLMADDTTFTAMRFLFEHTGGTISWDAQKHEVVARKGASTIRVQVGSKVASINNKQVMMQLAAFLFEGRTMIPTRFFEEGLNAHVEWNPETGHLVVAMAN